MNISEPAGLTRRQCLGRAAQALRPPGWRLRPRPTSGRSCSAWKSNSPPRNWGGTTTSAFPRACRLSTSNDVGADRVVDAVTTGIDLRVLSALTPGAQNLPGPEGAALAGRLDERLARLSQAAKSASALSPRCRAVSRGPSRRAGACGAQPGLPGRHDLRRRGRQVPRSRRLRAAAGQGGDAGRAHRHPSESGHRPPRGTCTTTT